MNVQHAKAVLRALQARYDDGAIPPAMFAVIKEAQEAIAWAEHRALQPKTWRERNE